MYLSGTKLPGVNRRVGEFIDINIPGARKHALAGGDREKEFEAKYKESKGSKRRTKKIKKIEERQEKLESQEPEFEMAKGGKVKKK